MRKRLYEIVEVGQENDIYSRMYDLFMMITIVVSVFPLMFKEEHPAFVIIDRITTGIFIIDYLLRLLTADYKLKKGWLSFLAYPFTAMALIDLLSILPSVTILSRSFRLFKMFRLFRTFRVFKVFKAFRYSKNINIIINVFKAQKDSLMVVCWLAVGYILVTALVIFNVESDTFDSFFDAVYWATISLTTVGYGDIYAVSVIGKIITMISSVFGIAIVALPAGIITAGYMAEIQKSKDTKNSERSENYEQNC